MIAMPSNRISTMADLEALYGEASSIAAAKEVATINPLYRRLIEAAPFCGIASVGPDGLDCSPRGDGPGFVQIIDERTVALPDRRGNRRLDTLGNIVRDPRVSMLFLIPGWNEAFRINGRAHLSTEPDLLAGMVMNGKTPQCAIVVEIDTLYFQCARAIKRAALWEESSKIEPATLPSAGQLLASAMEGFDAETYDEQREEQQARTLY